MRGLILALALSCVAGCGSTGPTQDSGLPIDPLAAIAGTYDLASVNGTAVPMKLPVDAANEIIGYASGTLAIDASHNYAESVTETVNNLGGINCPPSYAYLCQPSSSVQSLSFAGSITGSPASLSVAITTPTGTAPFTCSATSGRVTVVRGGLSFSYVRR